MEPEGSSPLSGETSLLFCTELESMSEKKSLSELCLTKSELCLTIFRLYFIVYYRVDMCPPPVPILSRINPVHAPILLPVRSNLNISSHLPLGLPSGLFPSGFPTKTLYTPLLSPINAVCPSPSHSSQFDHAKGFKYYSP